MKKWVNQTPILRCTDVLVGDNNEYETRTHLKEIKVECYELGYKVMQFTSKTFNCKAVKEFLSSEESYLESLTAKQLIGILEENLEKSKLSSLLLEALNRANKYPRVDNYLEHLVQSTDFIKVNEDGTYQLVAPNPF